MSLKQRAKAVLGKGILTAGIHRAALVSSGTIVAFHRVSDMIAEDGLTMGSARFEQFCRFFKANFDVIPLSEFVTRLREGRSVGGTMAITFDDGYLDNFEVAAPVLRAVGLPATFFVTTRFLGTTIVPWWDQDLPRQPGWMTWDHVHALARDGFDIGAHTRTHVDLGKVDSAEARQEIFGSRDDLTAQFGKPPAHFAYPYGGRQNIVEPNRDLVKEAGFACCVSSYGGLAPNGADPFRLQRVPISPWFETPEQLAFEVVALKG